MKLHPERNANLNTVTAYGDGWIQVNAERHQGPLLIAPEGPVEPWTPDSFESLSQHDFDALLARAPELVVLGTGARQRFPHPRLYARLTDARIGVEAMDTAAACRTYNILMAEGRRVIAALLPC